MLSMRSSSIFVLCLLGAAVLAVWSDTYGDEGGKQAPPIDEKGTPDYPNLISQLEAELDAFEAKAYSARSSARVPVDEPSLGEGPSPLDRSSLVDVTIYVTQDIDAVVRFLKSNGALVRNMGNTYIEASVPVALLGETSEQPGVIRVEPIIGPHLDVIPGPNPPTTNPPTTDDAMPPTTDDATPPTTGDAAPYIPEKEPQRFANLTSDLDGIAQDVDDGVFSVDSLTERALSYEQTTGDDGQAGADDTTVGVTIYALEDISAAASFLKQNGVAIRHQGETYLEAYVPVSLLGQASLQPDVIRIEPIVGPVVDQMTDPCVTDIGTITFPSSSTQTGSWTGTCDSENRPSRYARYYTFTLNASSVMTLDLTSSDADAFLYLMQGSGKRGNIIDLNDDGGDGRNSRIIHNLPFGTYTIEATTYASEDTGSFSLEINQVQLSLCAAPTMGELSGKNKVHRYGPWTEPCGSGNRPGKYAQYYSFTLSEATTVTISMTSSDLGASPHAYLIDGTEWSNNIIGEIRGGIPQRYHLRPGGYWIETTTAEPEPSGSPSSVTRLEVETSRPSITTNNGVTSRHGVSAWNDVGITGTGVKVGIIDSGFTGYDRFGSELPALAGFRCYLPPGSIYLGDPRDCAGSTYHGTVVAEALADIAPDASIYIANPRTAGDLREAVNWMIDQGVKVINQSLSYPYDGPGDGTSPFENSSLRSVDTAVDGGITWVNSAGNAQRGVWRGEYSNAVGSAQGNRFIEFDEDGTDEVMGLFISPTQPTQFIQLRWDDSWVGADTDLDLFIVDSRLRVVARSVDVQSGRAGHIPSELIPLSITGSGYGVVVRHTSGPAPDWIQLIVRGGGAILQHYTQGSITNPGESANPGLLAVGAAPWFDTYTIERFSGQGPTPDGRIKPDIVGADGSLSTIDGARRIPGEGPRRVYGTSQAAPHVAGMAALVRQQYPSFGPEDTANHLRNQALPRAESAEATVVKAPNNVWGHGFAYLPPSPLIPGGHPLTSPNPDSGDQYGISTAVNTDGSLVVIGSLSDGSNGEQSGAAYVFTETMVDYARQGILTASDGAAGDLLGSSAAMSNDGQTIALGAPGDGSGQGSAYIYTRPSTTWSNIASTIKLTASDGAAGDGFGSSIAMSGDGNTIVVGAHSNDATGAANAGAAYVFERPTSGSVFTAWVSSSAGIKLTASDAAADDEFGSSVSINQDGSIIAVGARGDSPGSVYVFNRPATGWAAAAGTITLTGPTNIDARAQLGESVSISGDGGTIVAGSPEAPGSAYVFTMPTNGWAATSTSARLTAPDDDSRDKFGGAVSVSSDGSSIAVGATAADTANRVDVGAVYMFTMPSTGWADTSAAAKLIRESFGFSGQAFGHAVSLSPDGSKVISSSPNDPDGGHVNYLDKPSTGGWVDAIGGSASFIHLSGRQIKSQFGRAVAVSEDEGTIVVGANNDDAAAGAAGAIYVFTRPTGGWGSAAPTRVRILAGDGAQFDGFGRAVSVSSNGSIIAVGANGDDDGGFNSSGSVYVYTRPSAGWSSSVTPIKLNPSDAAAGDQFGNAVAVSGDGNFIVVGADRENSSTGSVYLFTKPSGAWAATAAEAKLTTSDGVQNDRFGGTVSINTDGSVVVVGAIGRAAFDRMSDGAYVFNRPSSGSVYTAWASSSAPVKITPSEGGGAAMMFGSSVSISGDGNTIAVGAIGASGAVANAGAVYVFDKPATGWAAASSAIKLTAADGGAVDNFGQTVSVSNDGGKIAIGASGNDTDAIESGAAYIFTKPSAGWVTTSTSQRLPTEDVTEVDSDVGVAVSIGGTVTAVGVGAAADKDGSAYVYRPLTAPQLVGTIPDQTMPIGTSTLTVNTASNFSDPGTLTYTVATSNAAVATAAVTNAGVVTVTRVNGQGVPLEATISVTATNPNNMRATQSFTTAVQRAPDFPQDLNAVAYSSTEIEITWTAPEAYGGTIQYYQLQRKAGSGNYVLLQPNPTLTTPTVTYRDTGLTAGTTYTYRMSATSNLGFPTGFSDEVSATPTGDRAALTAFYDAMDGATTWRNKTNWKTAAKIDDWHGVTTDFNGRVTRLGLTRNGLQGALSTELENLPNLQLLTLNSNALTGGIPTELGSLGNLKYLHLGNSGLTGGIPTELGNLSNLGWLWLNDNQLTGQIPTQLGSLGDLQWLYLENNDLNGAIPTQLGSLSNLRGLYLQNNQLTGGIPTQLGDLSSLEQLRLDNNQLTGQIPTQLGDLSNLQQLLLDNNQLSMTIPMELGDLPILQYLWLDDNQLTGSIPTELGSLEYLVELRLNDNQLTGQIPTGLGSLSELQGLYLENNQLTMTIPTELGNLPNLSRLYLYNNQLTGGIPTQLGDLENLQVLLLHENDLSGTIPSELGDLSNLLVLYLNDNDLTGSIPTELGNLSNLFRLYIQENDLNGSIPMQLGSLSSLQHLYLNDNMLNGSIPMQLGSLSSLQHLLLNNNQLTGGIPTELGNLSGLVWLYLDNNQLTGGIPMQLGSLSSLQRLFLNNNQLTGEIPSQLGSLSSLQRLYIHHNMLNGSIPPQLGNLDNLEILAIHNNGLSGEIPSQLSNLSNLQWLYINNNMLTGEIPSQLGDLSNLQRLLLHSNQLSGQVPSELGDLSDLERLRLDNNDLTGAIPLTFTSLASLIQLYFDENSGGLCAPLDDAFQTWFMGITDRQGLNCGDPRLPATPTSVPTATPTPTATAVHTPTATPTATAVHTATNTPTPTATPRSAPAGGSGSAGGTGGDSSRSVRLPTPIPVSGIASMVISTDNLAFTAVQGGANPPMQSVSVWNARQPVNMPFNVSSETSWLSFSPASAESNSPFAKVAVQVSVDISGLTAGTHNGTFVIRANEAVNSPRTVAVTLTITAPPPTSTPGRTIEDTQIETSDASVRVDVPAGAARVDVEIRVTKLDVGTVGTPPSTPERVSSAADVQTFVNGAPTPMTYPEGVDLRFMLPEGDETACVDGRVRVYRVSGEVWTVLEHRCETDDAGREWVVATLTNFSTYVMTIEETPPTPTAVPTATPTAVPTATNTPVPTATTVPTAAPTDTPVPTATTVPTAMPTDTPMPVATTVPTAVPTATYTPVPTATTVPTAAPTDTPVPTATTVPTAVPTATNTPEPAATTPPTATRTPVSVAAAQPAATASPTPTAAAQPEDDGGGANVLAIILIALLLIAGGAVAVIYLMRRQGIELGR